MMYSFSDVSSAFTAVQKDAMSGFGSNIGRQHEVDEVTQALMAHHAKGNKEFDESEIRLWGRIGEKILEQLQANNRG